MKTDEQKDQAMTNPPDGQSGEAKCGRCEGRGFMRVLLGGTHNRNACPECLGSGIRRPSTNHAPIPNCCPVERIEREIREARQSSAAFGAIEDSPEIEQMVAEREKLMRGAQQAPTTSPSVGESGTPKRKHLVESAAYWFDGARKQPDKAHAIMAMENAYNHVENALAASRDEVAQARAQLAQVTAERDEAVHTINVMGCENIVQERDALRSQVEALKADSERLDWLSERCYWPDDHPEKGVFAVVSEDSAPFGKFTLEFEKDRVAFREAIDSDRAQQPKGER